MSPEALVGVSWFAKLAESEVFGWCWILNNTTLGVGVGFLV